MSAESLKMLENLAWAGVSGARPVGECEVLREIDELDIPVILTELREKNWAKANGESATGVRELRTLRTAHHQLAQLLASGVAVTEASLITGKSRQTIYRLQEDPAFRELLAFYGDVQKEISVNVYDRVNTIGALASEILIERLEENPEQFSNTQLAQLLEHAAPPKNVQGGGGNSAAPPVAVTVNFVAGDRVQRDVKLIDGKIVEEIESEQTGE